MKCTKESEIIIYADGEMEDSANRERIEEHIYSCAECQEWLKTYNMLRQAGDRINPDPEIIPEFKMSSALQSVIEERGAVIKMEPKWWEAISAWKHPVRTPVLLFSGALVLMIVGMFFWQIFQTRFPDASFQISGVSYLVWGDEKPLEHLQDLETPPALQSQQVHWHLGFLTPELIRVLQDPKPTDQFWSELSQALARQKISLTSPPQTLMVEDSLYADIKSNNDSSNRNIWIVLYKDRIVLVRWVGQ